MAVITYQDVATTIGRPIRDSDEQAQVTQWIADVELILGERLGDLSERDQAVLAYVEREVVAARMRYASDRNSEVNESQGQNRVNADNFFLTVLEQWWALLDPNDSGSGVFSARPYFEADTSAYDSWLVT